MGGGRLLDPEDPSRYQDKASGAKDQKPGPTGPGFRKPLGIAAIQKGMSSSISFAAGAGAAAAAESLLPPP